MRIAVPYENGEVFQHFGHSAQFKLYDADEGKILQEKIADATGSGHGALAGFLSGLKVDVLICGGIGAGAKEALSQQGIQLYGGVSGSADDAVRAYLSGSLQYNPDIQCTHHDHHGHDHHEHGHHGCHHHCGEDHHGCSGNNGSCGRS